MVASPQAPTRSNVVLIGMPGAGKSTVGILLAKVLSFGFVDTDVVIQSREGCRLYEVIRDRGLDEFQQVEAQAVESLDVQNHVIATGGSVVYSDSAMAHLQRHGVVVWLRLPLPVINARVGDLGDRGVAIQPGQTLGDLYNERQPLYERWSDITIEPAGFTQDQVVRQIVSALEEHDFS